MSRRNGNHTPKLSARLDWLRRWGVCAIAVLGLTHWAHGATIIYTWSGGASGSFNVGTNWDQASVPGTGGLDMRLLIDGGQPGNVVVNVTSTPGSAINKDIEISTGDTLAIANGIVVTIDGTFGGLIQNNGTISLNSNFHNTDLTFRDGNFSLTGSGVLTLSNHPNNRILSTTNTVALSNGSTHTIQGSGQIGVNLLGLTNAGLILANQSNTLALDPGPLGMTNTGTLRATSGATLSLQNGTFTNFVGGTLGLIKADDTSHVDLSAATILGGTLTSINTGHFHAMNGSVFNALTISSGSSVEVPNAHQLNLIGTITNSGTIKPLSNFHNTDLVANGNVTLTGGGAVTFSDHPNNRIIGVAATDVLTNENNTISGAGQLGANLMGFINRGTVLANLTNTLTLDPSAAGFTNKGTLRASSGGVLSLINGAFTNSESGVSGLIEALAGSRVDFNAVTIAGGNLATAGDGFLRNVGTVTFDNVTFTSNALFSAVNDADTTLVGTIANAGNLTLNSNFHNTDLIMSGGDVTLSGAGTVSFSNHGNNRIIGAVSTNRLINQANTIQGAGQVGANLMGLVNRGTIQATYNAGNALTIDLANANNANSGTIKAKTGATLNLTATTLDNFEGATGGLIRAESGTVQLTAGSVVTGGSLDVTGAGEIQFNAATFASGALTNSTTGVIRATGGASVLDGITLSNPAGGQIILNNDADLRLTAAGTYSNAGSIAINSTFHNTDLTISGGNVTISGGGTILLGDHPNNRFFGSVATDRLINVDQTIQGAGQLGLDLMGLTNRGTVVANAANVLTLDPSSAGVINRGILRGSGGVLNLVNGTFTNSEGGTSGTIEALANGRVDLNGATVIGGKFSTSGNGQVRNVGTATFDGVTIEPAASVAAVNDADTTLLGTITNNGTLSANSTFHNTDFIVGAATVTLTGTGTLLLSNHPNNRIVGSAPGNVLVNESNVISGAGQLGVDSVGFINRSQIVATAPNVLTIDPSAAGLVNRGILRANGGTLRLWNGTFTNSEGGVAGTIEALDGYQVELNGATIVGGLLKTAGSGTIFNTGTATLNQVTLFTGAVVSTNNDADTTLIGGLNNAGTLTLGSTFHNTDLVVSGGDVLLNGGGTVTFGNHPNNRLVGAVATNRLINDNNVIQGAGQIGADSVGLVNRGTILANQSNTLILDPSAVGFVNRGTFRADNAVLSLVNGTFTNSESGVSGTVEAINNGRVDVNNALLAGGFIASNTGGILRNVGTATLQDLTLVAGGSFSANNASITTLSGVITNHGTLSLNSSFHNTDLVISSPVTLNGTGVVALGDHPNNRILGGSTLTNSAGHTIRGSGQFGANQLTLTNLGTVEANQSNTLTLDLTGAFTNQGTLRASNSANLVVVDAFTNAGLIAALASSTVTAQAALTQSSGAISLNGGTFVAPSSTINGGAIQGSGTVSGPVTINAATIAPGAAGQSTGIGALVFNHSITLTPTSLLEFQLGGAASFDTIQAQSATLDGNLSVTFTNGFESLVQATDSFTLFTTSNASGLSGTFNGLANGSRLFVNTNGANFRIDYFANRFQLSDFQPIPEPSTYLLLGMGGLAVAWVYRRRKRL